MERLGQDVCPMIDIFYNVATWFHLVMFVSTRPLIICS